MRHFLFLFSCCWFLVFTLSNSILFAQATEDFTHSNEDQVSTLTLSEDLYSWGNLGGVAIDRMGFLYVANFAESVWRISPKGDVKLLTDGLYGGSGNTLDKEGNLYQANFIGNTILKIDRFGAISVHARQLLNGPVGMTFDKTDNLFVCNCNDNKILKISPRMGSAVFAEGPMFNCPNSITQDKEGNFYVVNFGNDHVVKITPSGEISRFATVGNAEGNAHIAYTNNHFYITKIKSNSLYKVDPEGNVTSIVGTFTPGHTDGPASKATLHRPNGIAVSPNGKTLYLNTLAGEWNSNQPTTITIRKVDLLTISGVFQKALEKSGLEEAVQAYQNYKNDPTRKAENTFGEMAGLGWQYMSAGKFKEATKVFQLNAESYPKNWRAHYNLGELNKIFGQKEAALEHYETALKFSPQNPSVTSKIKELKEK